MRAEMPAGEVMATLDALETRGVAAWIDGGAPPPGYLAI